MKNIVYKITFGFFMVTFSVSAGNEDRVGSAGASNLLINPWARSSALADAAYANTNGLEATYMNIAGLAYTDKTQIKFNHTNWMGSTAGIALSSAGIAQRISESSVIAISIQSMNFGDIPITTVANPEGNIGFFSPRSNIFSLGYARAFSSSISAGINLKIISESISNLRTSGVALDAGIRYVTGENEKIKFAISLKNIGPVMHYKGDGLAQQVSYISNESIASLEERSATFELPSLLSVGGSYDFIFDPKNKLNVALGFTANSFMKDQYRIGFDYGMTNNKFAFNIRAGYCYEKDIRDNENASNALVGPSFGFSVDALVGKNKNALGLEYCTRLAGIFGLIHTVGLTISLK